MTATFFEDLRIKNLYPIKLLLFLQAAGDMALYPFLTLHMKSLGISITEIGIQFAISPIACLVATPLVGLIADKIGNYKIMLFGSLLLAAIVGNLLLFVPPIQSLSKCIQTEEQLEFICPFNPNSLLTTSPSVETEEDTDNFAPLSMPKCFEKKQERKNKFGSNANTRPNPNKSAKILSYRFNHCKVSCRNDEKTKNLKWKDKTLTEFNGPGFCLTSEEFNEENCFGSLNDTISNQMQFSIDLSMNSQPVSNQFESTIHSIIRDIELTDRLVKNKSINRYQRINCLASGNDDCKIICPIEKATMLPNLQQIKVVDSRSHFITFWTYLVLRVFMVIIIATEMSLLKAAILTMVNANSSEYGYQRVWASYAVCIIPMITGVIMDKLISNGSTQTFSPCFYLFSGLKVIMAFVAFSLSLDLATPSAAIFSKLNELARRPEVSIFLFYAAFIGSVWGFIETFIVWYMEELGATRTLIGFSFSLSALSGIPFNIFAGFFERKCGHVPILIFTLFVFAFRLIGYSYSTNSYHILFFEAFDGFTSTLSIVILTTYANKLSSTDLLATMQAAWAALYFSVGRALGTVIGGFLMENVGYKLAYQTFAFMTIIGAIIYILIYRLYLKKIIDERDELEKKKVPTINYQSNLSTPNVEKVNGIDYNQNNVNSHKSDENIIVYRSGKDNLAFRLE